MPFTKAQRLKGLKKQLKNLGFEAVAVGGSVADESPDMDAEVADNERGSHTLQAMQAREEAW